MARVTGLLEREDELELLVAVADGAAADRGSVVFVGGEAGIGKTSLVRELRERVGGQLSYLMGACEPLSVPVPLAPLRQLAEAAGAGDLAELGSDDKLVLTRALVGALERRAPVVAVVEDVHWADPLTLDLVRLLARRVEEMPVALVLTLRDDEVAANRPLELLLGDLASAPAVRRIALRPLSDRAIRELAGSSGVDVAELARATGGNPFLVVEAVAAGGRLPASVRDASLARAGGDAFEIAIVHLEAAERMGNADLGAQCQGPIEKSAKAGLQAEISRQPPDLLLGAPAVEGEHIGREVVVRPDHVAFESRPLEVVDIRVDLCERARIFGAAVGATRDVGDLLERSLINVHG